MDSELNPAAKVWHMFTDDEKYQLQSKEANSIRLTAGTKPQIIVRFSVYTVLYGGQIESL